MLAKSRGNLEKILNLEIWSFFFMARPLFRQLFFQELKFQLRVLHVHLCTASCIYRVAASDCFFSDAPDPSKIIVLFAAHNRFISYSAQCSRFLREIFKMIGFSCL